MNKSFMLQKIVISLVLVGCTIGLPTSVSHATSSSGGIVTEQNLLLEKIRILKEQLASVESVVVAKKKNSNWETANIAGVFSISYPKGKGWYAKDLGNSRAVLGKTVIKNDFIWSVYSYQNSSTIKEELITEIGEQFSDRKVTKKKIKINGVSATLVTVTTKSHPEWEALSVFIDGRSVGYSEKLFVISNGAIRNSDFKTFYKSIKFNTPVKELKTQTSSKSLCSQSSLYGFAYYIAPNKDSVCYKTYELKDANSDSFIPLEAVSSDITQALLVDAKVKSEHYFGFDKKHFYIDGDVVYSSSNKSFKMVKAPVVGQEGSIIINGKTYRVVMTGLVGATLK